MRRMLLILLAVLLPLQFSWAGTAVYASGHAVAMLAATQGTEREHHHHQQRPDAKSMTNAADTKAAIDGDFGLCHLASVPFALTHSPSLYAARNIDAVPDSAVKAFASISTPAPDRPQWRRLA
jgi:hypothetical protein